MSIKSVNDNNMMAACSSLASLSQAMGRAMPHNIHLEQPHYNARISGIAIITLMDQLSVPSE